MKKILFKAIAVILTLTLCVTVLVPAFAADDNEAINRTCPKVYVPGFMTSLIYADVDDPDSDVIWPPSQDRILSAVEDAIIPIADLAVTKNFDRFGTNLSGVVDELFAPACLDYNGEPQEGTGVIFEYPDAEEIETDSTVQFNYDWRVDPLETAEELNKFIDYVLECSGSEQVVLECHSLGGVITLSYLKLYGVSKVKSVLFNSTAIYGETYTGELLTGNVVVSDQAINYYMDYAFAGTGINNFLSLLFDELTRAGVIDLVCRNANRLVDEIYDEVMMGVLRLFANWLTIWAMVPDDLVDDAKSYVFDEMYENAGVDYAGLKAKVDNYNSTVRANRTQTLNSVNNNANLYVVSRHGFSSFPLTPSWDNVSDGVIDTKYNSFGATVAKLNETLDVPESEYVSPDKTIDASTCLFPEQTWFIENIGHNEMPESYDTLVDTLLYYDGQATVDTFEEYPRFLHFDYKTGLLTYDEADVHLSFMQKLLAAITEIFKAIISAIM